MWLRLTIVMFAIVSHPLKFDDVDDDVQGIDEDDGEDYVGGGDFSGCLDPLTYMMFCLYSRQLKRN
jgi:hypothetical protein